MLKILKGHLEASLERTESSSVTIVRKLPNLILHYKPRTEAKEEELSDEEYRKVIDNVYQVSSKFNRELIY